MRLTRLTPLRNASPVTVNTPRAVSRATRTRISALATTAATGATVGGCGGRAARSISRLYSASVSVTARGVSVGRGGCCAEAASTTVNRIAVSVSVLDVMAHLSGGSED